MPRPNLSLQKIVHAAIRIADGEGLSAVTLRGVARQLNVHVTSLYNHIPTKKALYNEMREALVAESDLPVGSLTWQEWVRGFAVAMLSLAHRHPGAFQLFQRGPAQGQRAIESLESAAAAFREDGFDAVSTYSAIRAINVAVYGLIQDDLLRHLAPAGGAETNQLPGDRFPHLAEIHAVADQADSFGFFVDTLVAGIAANRKRGNSNPAR